MNEAENIRKLLAQLERAIVFEEWTMDDQYSYSESDYEVVGGSKIFTAEYLNNMPSGLAYRLARYETLVEIRDRLEESLKSAFDNPLDHPRFKIVFDDEQEGGDGGASWN